MQRINALNPDTTSGKSKELFNAIQKKNGYGPQYDADDGQFTRSA